MKGIKRVWGFVVRRFHISTFFPCGWTGHQMRGGMGIILLLLLSIATFFLFYLHRTTNVMDGVIFSLGFFLSLQISQTFLVSFSLGKWVLFVTEP